ncbi:HNH endonuclease [Leptospira meyeri]|uniref:HNH endonuclease n=1 Tax=Leptospira meyeri TaxID=29508 RepID=UPI0002BD8CFC|nr:HNH endonuclease [Leptospira meyeri]EMJ89494.1 HNH endonuclease domain protein [Leptospira meyeri serovar Semaranga str. Veldrot Semarang 173]
MKSKKNGNSYTTPTFACVNCDENIPWERPKKLFCSDLCQEEAKYIRYHRRAIYEGKDKIPKIALAIQIKQVSIISGGYSAKIRRIPNTLREKIFKQAKNRCKICNKPGNEIDHIKGSFNNLSNLQVLCWDCHTKKTKKAHKPINKSDPNEINSLFKNIELGKRVWDKRPTKSCDNHMTWDTLQKQIQENRKTKFYISISKFAIKHHYFKLNSNQIIANQLNLLNIPTYSGSGKWDRKLVGQKLKLTNK